MYTTAIVLMYSPKTVHGTVMGCNTHTLGLGPPRCCPGWGTRAPASHTLQRVAKITPRGSAPLVDAYPAAAQPVAIPGDVAQTTVSPSGQCISLGRCTRCPHLSAHTASLSPRAQRERHAPAIALRHILCWLQSNSQQSHSRHSPSLQSQSTYFQPAAKLLAQTSPAALHSPPLIPSHIRPAAAEPRSHVVAAVKSAAGARPQLPATSCAAAEAAAAGAGSASPPPAHLGAPTRRAGIHKLGNGALQPVALSGFRLIRPRAPGAAEP
jgi:hypothetical protein